MAALEFIQKPYVFALAIALVTAILAYAYSKVTDKDSNVSYRTFFKTLAAGALAGVVLTYLSTPRAEAMATEPFDLNNDALPVPSGAGF